MRRGSCSTTSSGRGRRRALGNLNAWHGHAVRSSETAGAVARADSASADADLRETDRGATVRVVHSATVDGYASWQQSTAQYKYHKYAHPKILMSREIFTSLLTRS